MREMTCHTCRHLGTIRDEADAGIYVCRKYPGLVVGKYSKRSNELTIDAYQDCWEEEA